MSIFVPAKKQLVALMATSALALMLGGCSTQLGKGFRFSDNLKGGQTELTPERLGTRTEKKQSQLVKKATDIAKAYRKNPQNGDVAMQYVYHLRALGMQQQAMTTLAEAYRHNPGHPVVASEYGRQLLGTGNSQMAARVLKKASTNGSRDWRTLSAMGTLAAREGRYAEAITHFSAAHKQQPKQASITNNLALALALEGRPDEAENLLRNADDTGRFGPRLRQNLALVLALQGKYDEAQDVATADLPPKQAAANIAYLKTMMEESQPGSSIEFTDATGPAVASVDAPTATGSLRGPTDDAVAALRPASAEAPIALTPQGQPARRKTVAH